MTASLSKAPALFSNRVTNDCPPLFKNKLNHCVEALDKKRGDTYLSKEDAEDGISAVTPYLDGCFSIF
jgi:hypothetical protein